MTPFLASAIVSFTLFLFVLGMRPNTMKAHGKEGMFRQLPLMTPFSSGGFTSQNADRWLISVFAAAAVFSILIFLMSLSIFFEETGSLWTQGILSFAYSFE
jgi:hypothetical protein